MRTFDYELRRHGFAGNQCQIILELDRRLAYDVLRDRLAALQSEYPIINARVGKIFRPKWKIMRGVKGIIPVLVHLDAPGLQQQLFNAKLWPRRGSGLFEFSPPDDGMIDSAPSLIRDVRHAALHCVAEEPHQ